MRKIIMCIDCGEQKYNHAHGRCYKCYLRYWAKMNPEKSRAIKKKYRDTHIEQRKKYNDSYRATHQKEIRQKGRVYYYRTQEQSRARYKRNYDNGPYINRRIYRTEHADYWKYSYGKLEHTLMAEKILERKLKPQECVHHMDCNGLNNTHSNLIICTRSYHKWLHAHAY